MCDGILVSVREDGDLMDPFEEGHESATEPAVVDPAIVAPPDAPVVVDSLVQGLVGVSLGTEALDLPGGSGAAASSSSDAAAMPAASAGGAGSAGGASLGPVGWIKNSDGHVYNQEGRWIGRITTFSGNIAIKCTLHGSKCSIARRTTKVSEEQAMHWLWRGEQELPLALGASAGEQTHAMVRHKAMNL